MLLTKADAARALGVHPSAISNALRDGRLVPVTGPDGKEMINGETLREDWKQNTRARMRPVNVRTKSQPLSRASSDVPDYNESRARTEHLKAELLELEGAEKEGELVRADEVAKKWGEVVAIARTKVMGIPTKAKQRIPEIPDDAFQALEEIVREALEDLADG